MDLLKLIPSTFPLITSKFPKILSKNSKSICWTVKSWWKIILIISIKQVVVAVLWTRKTLQILKVLKLKEQIIMVLFDNLKESIEDKDRVKRAIHRTLNRELSLKVHRICNPELNKLKWNWGTKNQSRSFRDTFRRISKILISIILRMEQQAN